jgi:hypothetical protein
MAIFESLDRMAQLIDVCHLNHDPMNGGWRWHVKSALRVSRLSRWKRLCTPGLSPGGFSYQAAISARCRDVRLMRARLAACRWLWPAATRWRARSMPVGSDSRTVAITGCGAAAGAGS